MPALTFLAAVGLALIALLFIADAKLENVLPIATSDRIGLPEPWHPGKSEPLIEPGIGGDIASEATPPVQPKPNPEAKIQIGPAARAARAQAPHRVTAQPSDHRQSRSQRNNSVDRFSIGGQ
jgi:hypothetical protein